MQKENWWQQTNIPILFHTSKRSICNPTSIHNNGLENICTGLLCYRSAEQLCMQIRQPWKGWWQRVTAKFQRIAKWTCHSWLLWLEHLVWKAWDHQRIRQIFPWEVRGKNGYVSSFETWHLFLQENQHQRPSFSIEVPFLSFSDLREASFSFWDSSASVGLFYCYSCHATDLAGHQPNTSHQLFSSRSWHFSVLLQ